MESLCIRLFMRLGQNVVNVYKFTHICFILTFTLNLACTHREQYWLKAMYITFTCKYISIYIYKLCTGRFSNIQIYIVSYTYITVWSVSWYQTACTPSNVCILTWYQFEARNSQRTGQNTEKESSVGFFE